MGQQRKNKTTTEKKVVRPKSRKLEFLTEQQRQAAELYKNNDILFLIGPAGSGKSHIAVAFAISEILEKTKEKVLLSRPVIEAGENLGFLTGSIAEKVAPYMLPLYDCLEKMCGIEGDPDRDFVNKRVELAPLAYLRGRTFSNAVCILDEAQNCTAAQLKLFLTRLGKNSKMIITGDPSQSDLGRNPDLLKVVNRVKGIEGVAALEFTDDNIVRHPIIAQILKKLNEF